MKKIQILTLGFLVSLNCQAMNEPDLSMNAPLEAPSETQLQGFSAPEMQAGHAEQSGILSAVAPNETSEFDKKIEAALKPVLITPSQPIVSEPNAQGMSAFDKKIASALRPVLITDDHAAISAPKNAQEESEFDKKIASALKPITTDVLPCLPEVLSSNASVTLEGNRKIEETLNPVADQAEEGTSALSDVLTTEDVSVQIEPASILNLATPKNPKIRKIFSIEPKYLNYSKGRAIVEVVTQAWRDTSAAIRGHRDWISTTCTIFSQLLNYKKQLKENVLKTLNVNTNNALIKLALNKSTHRWYIDLETFEDQYGNNLEFLQNGSSFAGDFISQLVQEGAYYIAADGQISYQEEKFLKAAEGVTGALNSTSVLSDFDDYNAVVKQINKSISSVIASNHDIETARDFELLNLTSLQERLVPNSILKNSIKIGNSIFPGAFYRSRLTELQRIIAKSSDLVMMDNLFFLRMLDVQYSQNNKNFVGMVFDLKLNPDVLNKYEASLEGNLEAKHVVTLMKFWLVKWRYDLTVCLPGLSLE